VNNSKIVKLINQIS